MRRVARESPRILLRHGRSQMPKEQGWSSWIGQLAEFAEAKEDYDEAKQKLEEEFKKENPNNKYIEFLTANKQDAQKRIELLLQKQSQPSEAQQGRTYPVLPSRVK